MAGSMLHATAPRCTCWTASAPALLSLHLERLADRRGPAQAARRPLRAIQVRKLKALCQVMLRCTSSRAQQGRVLQSGAVDAFAEITGDELGDVDAFAELVSLAVAKDPRLAAAGAHALDSANSRGAAASAVGEAECSGCGSDYLHAAVATLSTLLPGSDQGGRSI